MAAAQDTNKSSSSIASDYEELAILQESGKSVVHDSDFEENCQPPAKPNRASSVKSSKSGKSASVKSDKSASVKSEKSASVKSEKLASSSFSSAKSDNSAAKSVSITSEQSLSPATKPRSVTVESDASLADSKTGDVFTDLSETVVLTPHNGKHSDSSSYVSDKENQEKRDQEMEEEEERCLSVKEALNAAQEKERQAIGNAVLLRKTDRQDLVLSKKYLSTDSEMSDRSSEASDAPSKPPRNKSPARNELRETSVPKEDLVHKGVITEQVRASSVVDSSPNTTIHGLRAVDSPILKLLDDLDKKDDEEVIIILLLPVFVPLSLSDCYPPCLTICYSSQYLSKV